MEGCHGGEWQPQPWSGHKSEVECGPLVQSGAPLPRVLLRGMGGPWRPTVSSTLYLSVGGTHGFQKRVLLAPTGTPAPLTPTILLAQRQDLHSYCGNVGFWKYHWVQVAMNFNWARLQTSPLREVRTQLKTLLIENTLGQPRRTPGDAGGGTAHLSQQPLKDGKIWSKQKNWFFY